MRRSIKLAISSFAAAVVAVACHSNVEPPRGGLVLTVANDGTLQLDRLKVEVVDGSNVLLQNEFAIPATPLPNTLSIVSNGKATTTATITVSGWLNGIPVDRRDAIVTQIPSDRVAALYLTLSGRCTPFVKAGSDATTAVSTCADGQTCSVDGGTAHCAGASVDASGLPDFNSDPSNGVGTGPAQGSNTNTGGCTEGSLQCSALQPQACTGGSWHDQGALCPHACKDGACTGECSPGAAKCAGNGVVTCGADSMWGAAVACAASTPACNGAGECGVCATGSKQCSDANTTQTCGTNGLWATATACPANAGSCNGAGGCGVCHAGDAKCENGASVICGADGAWGAPMACAQACVSGACTGICKPGTTRCTTDAPMPPQQTCSGVGSWVNDPVTAAVCGAMCTPGQSRCNGATPQTCNAVGNWQSGAINAGQCGAVCTPGVTPDRCVGTTHEPCIASGQWGTPVVTVGVCGAVCSPGSAQCVGASSATYQTCNSTGTWNAGSVVAGQCGAVCSPNQKACLNTEKGGTICTTPGSCWWLWSNETIYDETCTSVGQWGPRNLCTGKCAGTPGTNNISYYDCDANAGGCIPQGVPCSAL